MVGVEFWWRPHGGSITRKRKGDERQQRSVVSSRLLSTCYRFCSLRLLSECVRPKSVRSRRVSRRPKHGHKKKEKSSAKCNRSCKNMWFAYTISFQVVQLHRIQNMSEKQDENIASNRWWAATKTKRDEKREFVPIAHAEWHAVVSISFRCAAPIHRAWQ